MNGNSAEIRAAIPQIDLFTTSGGLQSAGAIWRSVLLDVFLQPGEIFISAGCVHDEQKFLLVDPINDQIIDDSAVFVEEKSVLPLANFQLIDVVSQHRIQPFGRRRTADNQLSHVGNIEDPDVISHGVMFFEDARVLHGHEPPAERNDFRAEPQMLLIQWRGFLRGFAHAGKRSTGRGD